MRPDKEHGASPGWLAAQKQDGRFVTEYARKKGLGFQSSTADPQRTRSTVIFPSRRSPAPSLPRK
jgi:hypothetical protein